MQIPLIGEVTPLRAFFLFLFFYSNDSNNLSTWSTFLAGMLLSNLMEKLKGDKINYQEAGLYALVTFACLGYATLYLEQGRMMCFLALQSLFVPVYQIKVCKVINAEGNPEIDTKRLMSALTLLMVGLYVYDGLSGLTSGTMFLIYMPEIAKRMSPLPAIRTILFLLLVVCCCAPFGLVVLGAVYYEKEVMQAPEEYRNMVKMVVGARPESVPDYYKIIGVKRGAEPSEIKKVFRELSKLYHPDKTAGHPELQARFVEISDAVRKLTGKGSDRESFIKELENAELQDTITRCVYFCLLFALWFVMTMLSYMSRPKDPSAGGEEGDAPRVEAPKKPRVPMTRMQWMWLLLSVPIAWGWLWMENHWATVSEA
uniref:J domain-containing protein n=1 Tax=Hemiselmis andersenii TaxID=464988 RepID=A0A6U4RTZ7_HEMAN|mmetsp:Transcript_3112/g.7162  ORF Transcript_3112/g.7162 Transcript_3112/m.7162 type:complete len:370 (-) Transcript_3112:74-1183(-)